MDTAALQRALAGDRVIDITTIGRKTGTPRRIEIWFHRVEGRYFITGTPGARSWYANLLANPEFTFHLKQSAQADLAARARPIEGPEKQRLLSAITAGVADRRISLDPAASPLVEVTFADAA